MWTQMICRIISHFMMWLICHELRFSIWNGCTVRATPEPWFFTYSGHLMIKYKSSNSKTNSQNHQKLLRDRPRHGLQDRSRKVPLLHCIAPRCQSIPIPIAHGLLDSTRCKLTDFFESANQILCRTFQGLELPTHVQEALRNACPWKDWTALLLHRW